MKTKLMLKVIQDTSASGSYQRAIKDMNDKFNKKRYSYHE